MTAEIAILNLEAVALAADSAVTAYPGGNQKIFSSQNKLFALSDVAPVGVLIYGNASFMSIPWETLVKEYRRSRGTQTFDELDDYMQDFCHFLVDHIGPYISESHQTGFYKSLVEQVYFEIAQQVREKVSDELRSNFANGTPIEDQFVASLANVTRETVDQYHSRARKAQLVEGVTTNAVREIRQAFSMDFREIRNRAFMQKIDSATARKLNIIAEKSLGAMLDDILLHSPGPSTGIVVAGFGDKNLFPSYSEVLVEGLIGDVLKGRHRLHGKVGPDNRAVIVPFAQSEMVHEFMQGIAPIYFDYLYKSMISHLEEYTVAILDSLDQYSDGDKAILHEALSNTYHEIADSFVAQVDDMGRRYLAGDIVDVVTLLPKDQLAEMAEALVSLTSLKRKVSPQDETVGGPTDVAVISKSDGLIWIRRKHYFSSDLNPRYLARTYSGGNGHAPENAQAESDFVSDRKA